MTKTASSLLNDTTRRDFLAASTAAVAALATLPAVHAAGSDVLRVGLVGCGGRGSGAVEQALNADANVKLTALGDAFPDQLKPCLDRLKNPEKPCRHARRERAVVLRLRRV